MPTSRGAGCVFPADDWNRGETPLEALYREVYEEIGGKISEPHPLGHYLVDHDDGRRTSIPVFIADVIERGEVPTGTESRGVVTLSREEFPQRYFTWDALFAAVFEEALRTRCRLLRQA